MRAVATSQGISTRMAWSKGFFRLWLLLALLWMGVAFALLGKGEFVGLWKPKSVIEVEYHGGLKDVLDSSRRSEDLRRQVVEGVSKGAVLLQKTDAADAKKQIEGANGTAD